jgi:hypothetical protein
MRGTAVRRADRRLRGSEIVTAMSGETLPETASLESGATLLKTAF